VKETRSAEKEKRGGRGLRGLAQGKKRTSPQGKGDCFFLKEGRNLLYYPRKRTLQKEGKRTSRQRKKKGVSHILFP